MNKFKTTLVLSALALATSAVNAETFDVIVKHKTQMSAMSKDGAASKAQLVNTMSMVDAQITKMKHRSTGKSNYTIVTVEAADAQSALVSLKRSGQFDEVSIVPQMTVPSPKGAVSYRAHASSVDGGTPMDLYYSDQQGYMAALKAGNNHTGDTYSGHNFEAVWANEPENTTTVRVGVADGGFAKHKDVAFASESADFIDNDGDAFAEDESIFLPGENSCSPHGNGVASGIAALHDGVVGIVGAATNVEVVAARVLDCGIGGLQFVDAVQWFAGKSYAHLGIPDISEPVDVINLSVGGESICGNYTAESIKYATDRGIPVVIAAGNASINVDDWFPANCEGVITVGATNWTHDKADFSNYGGKLTLSAQGVDVLGYGAENAGSEGYAMWWEGTSNAAPIVAGAIANVKSRGADLSNDELDYFLRATANDFASDSECTTNDNMCGAGSLNAYNLTEASVRYANNELGYIKHSVADNSTCDAQLLIDQLGESARICEMYTVSFNEFATAKNGLSYNMYRVTKGTEMTESNAELFLENEAQPHFNMVLTQEELDSYDYGYTMCDNGTCSTTILPMTVDSTKNAECP